MGARAAKIGALAAGTINQWWEPDALFAWSPLNDPDSAQIDPIVGSVAPKTSASAATAALALWDMTSSVYSVSAGAKASLDVTLPFMMALVVDKNNQASTFVICFEMGLGTSYIGFGFAASASAPVFKVSFNNGAVTGSYASAASFVKGNVAVHWLYCNPSDATHTFSAGVDQTITTQSGVVALPTPSIPRNITFGAQYGATTGISQLKQGSSQIVGNRSGVNALTLAQALAIVAKIPKS